MPNSDKKKNSDQKKLPGELQHGDIAYYFDKSDKRKLVEVVKVPPGHVLVKLESADEGCEAIMMTIPMDDLHPLILQ